MDSGGEEKREEMRLGEKRARRGTEREKGEWKKRRGGRKRRRDETKREVMRQEVPTDREEKMKKFCSQVTHPRTGRAEPRERDDD